MTCTSVEDHAVTIEVAYEDVAVAGAPAYTVWGRIFDDGGFSFSVYGDSDWNKNINASKYSFHGEKYSFNHKTNGDLSTLIAIKDTPFMIKGDVIKFNCP